MIRSILSTAFLIAAIGIFVVYTKPAYDTVQTQAAETASYDAALTKAAQLQQLKQGLLSRYNAFNANDVARLQKLLPDHVDNVALVLDLDSLASHYGLGLANVTVSQPKSEQATTVIGSTSGQKYDSLTLAFVTHGTYDQFRSFINDLETSLRIVDLEDLSITGGDQSLGGIPTYDYKITLRTYWLK